MAIAIALQLSYIGFRRKYLLINPQLTDYIRNAFSQGLKKDKIESDLIAAGWGRADVDEALDAVTSVATPPSPSGVMPNITGLLGVFDLLSLTFDIYKKRFKTFIGILLLSNAGTFLVVVVGAIVLLVMALMMGFTSSNSNAPLSPAFYGVALVAVVILMVMSVFVGFLQVWGNAALIYAIKNSDKGVGFRESFRETKRRVVSLWWATLILGLVTVGAYLFFFVPGIIFSVWFAFTAFVVIDEDLNGFNALLKSRAYVRGRWFDVLVRIIFISLVMMVIGSALAIVFIIPILILAVLGINLGYVLNLFLGPFLTPITFIYMYLVYKSLKAENGKMVFVTTKRSKVILFLTGLMPFIFFLMMIMALGALAAINPTKQIQTARDSARTSDVINLTEGLALYYSDNNVYPNALSLLVPDYIKSVSVDPVTKLPYKYSSEIGGASYSLCVTYDVTGKEECSGPNGQTDFSEETTFPEPTFSLEPVETPTATSGAFNSF